MEKRSEILKMRAKDIKHGFGNPRKITKAKKEELRESMEQLKDFGILLIDEDDNIIAGNQRLSIYLEQNPDQMVDCKRLIGYTKAELRAINIKDNTHAGDWDVDIISEWNADLNINLGIKNDGSEIEKKVIPDMELIHYEKYNYVLIACRSELDFNDLARRLGIMGKKVPVTDKRKINARAIWYDNIKAQIVPFDEVDQ